MRFLSTALAGVWLALGLQASGIWARPVADPVSRELRLLASRASQTHAWPPLRRYAESTHEPERRGLAYLVLGYREYEAAQYLSATADLGLAAATGFSLADFAAYYRAEAARAAHEPLKVVEALQGFSNHHPDSTLRYEALALLGQALLQTGQPERAIQALTAQPKANDRPALALLLARAYWQARKLPEAARAFENVYCTFPTASESAIAEAALRQLKAQLGADFPQLSEEMQTAQADTLFNSSRFTEALRDYDTLLQGQPASPLAERWRLGRARSLLRLKRAREAIETLESTASTNPQTDAERLQTLVDANAQGEKEVAMLQALDQLRVLYPESSSYGSALSSTAAFFARRGDWVTAARYYQPLAELFPLTDLGRDANWRVAWDYYLQAKIDKARQAFADHLKRYPTSPHLPAALYWLGRLSEESGAMLEAHALYKLLQQRFVQSYYALQASLRMKMFPGELRAGSRPRKSTANLPVAELAQIIPPREPPLIRPCVPVPTSEILRPFLTLKALSLESLGEQYLKRALSDRPAALDLQIAWSRLEAEQMNYSEALFGARKLVPNFSEYEFSELPREIWELLYPRVYWNLVERQARANRLDPYLLMGLIRQESAFNPLAISPANARGLLQVLPQTANPSGRRAAAMARRLYDPAYNVRVACRYLRGLLKTFEGSREEALAAYNAGDFRVKDWLNARSYREPAEFVESIPFRETRIYVQSVLRDADVYRRLLTGSAKVGKCSSLTVNSRRLTVKSSHLCSPN